MKSSFEAFVEFVASFHDGICGITFKDIKRRKLFDFREVDGVLTFKKNRYAILDESYAAFGSENRADFEVTYAFDPATTDLTVVACQLKSVSFDWDAYVDSMFENTYFGDESYTITHDGNRYMLESSFAGKVAEASTLEDLHAACLRDADGYVDAAINNVDIKGSIDWFVLKETGIPFSYDGETPQPKREEIEERVMMRLEDLFQTALDEFEAYELDGEEM